MGERVKNRNQSAEPIATGQQNEDRVPGFIVGMRRASFPDSEMEEAGKTLRGRERPRGVAVLEKSVGPAAAIVREQAYGREEGNCTAMRWWRRGKGKSGSDARGAMLGLEFSACARWAG